MNFGWKNLNDGVIPDQNSLLSYLLIDVANWIDGVLVCVKSLIPDFKRFFFWYSIVIKVNILISCDLSL